MVKIGRLHLHGPQAWPDNLLDAQLRGPLAGAVAASGRLAVGLELRRSSLDRVIWLDVYLGWWAFEAYLDVDGEYEDDET